MPYCGVHLHSYASLLHRCSIRNLALVEMIRSPAHKIWQLDKHGDVEKHPAGNECVLLVPHAFLYGHSHPWEQCGLWDLCSVRAQWLSDSSDVHVSVPHLKVGSQLVDIPELEVAQNLYFEWVQHQWIRIEVSLDRLTIDLLSVLSLYFCADFWVFTKNLWDTFWHCKWLGLVTQELSLVCDRDHGHCGVRGLLPEVHHGMNAGNPCLLLGCRRGLLLRCDPHELAQVRDSWREDILTSHAAAEQKEAEETSDHGPSERILEMKANEVKESKRLAEVMNSSRLQDSDA